MAGRYLFDKEWRRKNPKKRQVSSARNYRKGATHQECARRHWSIDDELLINTTNRPHDRRLAQILGRTVQAIQIHRSEMATRET
jgi:hypothetical protein